MVSAKKARLALFKSEACNPSYQTYEVPIVPYPLSALLKCKKVVRLVSVLVQLRLLNFICSFYTSIHPLYFNINPMRSLTFS